MLVTEGGHYGDITKFEILADGKDISQAIFSVHIFQSIFEHFWSAELFVSDTVDMKQLIPLKRGTKFQITVATDLGSRLDGEKTYTFVLQSINNGSLPNHQQTTYILNLVHPILINDNKIRVSEVYDNQYHDQIIKKIVQQYLGGFNVQGHNSDTAITCLIPNWTPLDTIAWLTKSATKAGSADFTFFQNDNESFEFNSLFSMYKEGHSGIEFNRKPTNLSFQHDAKYDYSFNANKIFTDYFDAVLEMVSGYYGSTVWSFDQIRKRMVKHVYNAPNEDPRWDSEDPTESSIIGANTTAQRYLPHMRAYDSGKTILETAQNWVSNRITTMVRADINKLMIQTTGVAKAWTLLGKCCNINLPSQQDRDDNKYNIEYSGRYLMTGVTQIISRDSFMVNYSLIKMKLKD